MTFNHYRNIAILACSSILASCDQIVQTTPKTIEGEWKCAEDHYEAGKTNYYINIEYTDSTKKAIKITNFNNLEGFCKATISGSNITIPSQKIETHTIKGSGFISPDYKNLSFDYNDDIYGNGGGPVTAKCVRLE